MLILLFVHIYLIKFCQVFKLSPYISQVACGVPLCIHLRAKLDAFQCKIVLFSGTSLITTLGIAFVDFWGKIWKFCRVNIILELLEQIVCWMKIFRNTRQCVGLPPARTKHDGSPIHHTATCPQYSPIDTQESVRNTCKHATVEQGL